MSVDRNVVYGTESGRSLLLDVYRPTRSGPRRPGVLVVHGGGWVSGDRSGDAGESAELARAGFVAFDANYTLATPGQPGWPLQLQELRNAVRWIRRHAGTYGVDPQRIGALGGSAGANLVQLLGDDASGSCMSGDRIAAVVSWSGPTDLRALGTAEIGCLHRGNACASVGAAGLLLALVSRFLGCSVQACPQAWSAASPVDHVSSSASPMLLVNSTQELVPLSQAQSLSAALTAARIPHELIVYPGSAHAEAYSAQALAPSISFLRRYLVGR